MGDFANLAVWLIVILAIVGIVWGFVQYSGVVIPRPLKIVLYAILAIFAILFLVEFAGGRPGFWRR